MTYTNARIVKALDREIGFRRRVYGKNVRAGKMSEETMNEEIGIFEQVRDDYARKAAADAAHMELPF